MKNTHLRLAFLLLSFGCQWPAALCDELDELLDGGARGGRVVESADVKDDWSAALDLLAQRKYEDGLKRLDGLSAIQDFVNPRRRDFIAIARQVIEFPNWLEGEKDGVREAYSKALGKVRRAETALNNLQNEEERARFGGSNIPEGTRKRIDADRSRVEGELQTANADRVRIQKDAVGFESVKLTELERKVCRWIDTDNKGEDIETAYILSTMFLDCAGDSGTIRQRSQDLERRRSLYDQSVKIVEIIETRVSLLKSDSKEQEAREELMRLVGKVNASEQDPFVKATVTNRLLALFPSTMIAGTKWEYTAIDGRQKTFTTFHSDGTATVVVGPIEYEKTWSFSQNGTLMIKHPGNSHTWVLSEDYSKATIRIDNAPGIVLRATRVDIVATRGDAVSVRFGKGPLPVSSPQLFGDESRGRWKTEGGNWQFHENKLTGSGKGRITLELGRQVPLTIEFKLKVVNGKRPRITVANTTLGNEGYHRTLALYPRAGVEHIGPEGNAYSLNKEIGVTLRITENGVTYIRDGQPWQRRSYKVSAVPSIHFSCGDGWSTGTIEISDLSVK